MSEKHPNQPQQPEEPELRRDLPGTDNPHEPWARQEEVGDIYSAEITDEGRIERADKLTLRPMVWIGCLAAYNNGELHGDWVDAAVEGEDLVRSAQEILSRSPEPDAEEWAIFDDDEFGSYRVEQYDSLEHVARVARGIREHGHAFAAWAELHDGDEAMLDGFEDAYLGEYESQEAWGREVLDDLNLDGFLQMGAIPEAIRPYLHIDYEGWARDAELSGDVYTEQAPGGGIYVFSTL
ncbi:antirestriction protein ArdA [Nocardioides sp. TRM66260-LWL]|uniref:antirestriction protein ArdA n=1 Tax=Nocardioides sp. TRM66260-LWL TaxID=2874478 RepID=UPI001CC76B6B|nr:antirestriction protein ArdA [Nocardioides sp. TRM66260-LWL]MBZ5736302.1 antirestriction protein ArdA [Nocardioides sp. TRM66260-LWL]